MLQIIRDKLSGWIAIVVLGAISIVFILWGMKSANTVSTDAATVNGDKITLREAQQAWQRQQAQLQQALKAEIPDSLKKSQQQAVLDRLIDQHLIATRIEDLGYRVSDDQLDKEIKSMDVFKRDGKFDSAYYSSLLLSKGIARSQFEAEQRQSMLFEQFQRGIADTAFITPTEAARAQALLNEQRDVEYATVAVKMFLPTINISDAEAQAYYSANKGSYLTPETVDLQYVELKLADVAAEVPVSDDALRTYYEQNKDKFNTTERRHAHHILITVGDGVDDGAAKKKAEDIYAKIKSGGNFETLAKENSKDPGSAAKGGDLGWAKRGDYVKPFEDALFSMSPGEVRGPIKSDFGYHIIRLDEVEGSSKTFEQVRAEVETDYRNDQAHSIFYDKTQKLADAAFSKVTELDSVAKEFNTTVKTIPGFTRDGGGDFTKGSPVIDAAFSEAVLEKGQNSPLITIGEDRALVVRISDHKLPEQEPFEQVRADIVAILKDNAAKAAVAQKSEELVKQLRDGSIQWDAAVKQVSATLTAKQSIARNGSSVPAPIIKAAFALPRNAMTADKPAFSTALLDNGDYAIINVSNVKSGTEIANAAQALPSIEAQQSAMIGRTEFAAYVQELKRTAKIEKNPNAFD